MKSTLKILLFLLLMGNCCYAQQQGRDIPYLKIKDTVLLKQIISMSDELEKYGDGFKKGYGYISLHIDQFSGSSDTLITYFLSPQLMFLTAKGNENLYPDFYSRVNNKLITIYVNPLLDFYFAKRSFTAKSKKKIRYLIDKTLEKPGPLIKFNGKKIHLRFNSITFGGIKIYIRRNGAAIIKQVREG